MASGMPTHFRNAAGEQIAITTHVHLISDHVTAGLPAVRQIEGVISATVFGQTINVLVDARATDAAIRSGLAASGLHKIDIRPIAPSLEDVFVELTSNRNRAQG